MIKSFPCFAPQGQKQGKTELFMVAGLREMQENQGLSENQIDKLEFITLMWDPLHTMFQHLCRWIHQSDHPISRYRSKQSRTHNARF